MRSCTSKVLGGSYGVEKLYHYQMKPEMGPPDTKLYEFPGPDESWRKEMMEFEKDVELKRQPDAGLAEARAALQIVEKFIRKAAGWIYDYCAFTFARHPRRRRDGFAVVLRKIRRLPHRGGD